MLPCVSCLIDNPSNALSFPTISYKYKIHEKLTNYVTNYDNS